MSEPDAVLVVAPNWLGAAVMALPAIADVRRHFAARPVVVATRASVSSLFTLVPGVDGVVTAEAAAIAAAKTSTAVLFPNSFASAWLVTINQLADMVCAIAGVSLAKKHVPGPQGVRGRNSDNSRLRQVLKWEPSITLEDGLARTYAWIEEQVQNKVAQRL